MKSPRVPLLLLIALASTSACSKSCNSFTLTTWSYANEPIEFVVHAGATQHAINGKVLHFDAAKHTVTLAHDAIPNYMDAMTMEFKVKEAWPFRAGIMAEGDRLRGTLVVDVARSWIENVTVAKASGTNAATAARGSWVPADKGTPLPDVPLIDQDGVAMRLDRYRGHPLLMAFSYSRCPLPDYCPLTMANFAQIERATAKATPKATAKATPNDAALEDLRLLIVTIDPAHDTPEVLRQYGLKYATGDGASHPFARWNLATGTPEDVKRLAAFFGLDYFQEARSITHSLRTAIVDPSGRVYRVFEGNDWQVDDVLNSLRELAGNAAKEAGKT